MFKRYAKTAPVFTPSTNIMLAFLLWMGIPANYFFKKIFTDAFVQEHNCDEGNRCDPSKTYCETDDNVIENFHKNY